MSGPRLRARVPRRAWLALGLAALVLAAAGAALAAEPRTIVVRGRTLSPDGRPLVGARVMARGSVSVSAMTDERGRYSLSLPLGMPAALRRLPFKIEVRAEADGRRLSLAGGGQALTLDASWAASAERPRVQSNRQAAATAVATALVVDDVTVAWIEADFGGGPRAAADGPPARGATPPVASAVTSPAPRNTAPGPPARPPVLRERAEVPPPAPARSAPRVAASVAADSVPAGSAPPAAPVPGSVPRNRASAPATPPPVVSTRTATPPPVVSTRTVAPPPVVSTRTVAPPPLVVSTRTVDPPPPPRSTAVRAIDPFARRDSAARADSCRCTLRGTVEIHWDRPLENNTPVRLELDAPGAKPVEVSLFMGAPREFSFGLLPCGDWRLSVKPGGRLRYADVAGDSARVVTCAGAAATRVVLVPVRR